MAQLFDKIYIYAAPVKQYRSEIRCRTRDGTSRIHPSPSQAKGVFLGPKPSQAKPGAWRPKPKPSQAGSTQAQAKPTKPKVAGLAWLGVFFFRFYLRYWLWWFTMCSERCLPALPNPQSHSHTQIQDTRR